MQYLESFSLPTENEETGYKLSHPPQLSMRCYMDNPYPFGLFPGRGLTALSFAPVTILYGGNGSGKSTLLNIMAQKLEISRTAPFNRAPCFDDYLSFCRYRMMIGKRPPAGSRIVTSDDVFDFLLDRRAINEGIDARREELFAEYDAKKNEHFQMRSLDDYRELRVHNEAKHRTKSAYVGDRLSREVAAKSNGESAFAYFTDAIRESALYLLDEPENSLSAGLQEELVRFLSDSARFYHCQFIISTHSPFILSMSGARIYDLDDAPVREKCWTELPSVRAYYRLFESHKNEFQ